MAVTFKIDGLDELRKALLDAPEQIQAQAETIVREAAESAASEARSRYEQHRTSIETYTPGKGVRRARRHLADSVSVSFRGAKSGSAVGRIVVDAPHAHLFEFGTQQREWLGGKSTGAAPPNATLIPIAIRRRRGMTVDLIETVERIGLKVTGDA